MYEWPMWTKQSPLLWWEDMMEDVHSLWDSSCAVCLGNWCPIGFCQSSAMSLFKRGSESEKGLSSFQTSPSRASLAAVSAAELPLMPTWPRTQTKTSSFPSCINSECSS